MKTKWVYLVYCNTDPIVYGCYGNKKKALAYALKLKAWRQQEAIEKKHKFDLYHEEFERRIYKENDFDKREKTIYSTCLKVKDQDGAFVKNSDGCHIKVIRRPIN